MGLALVSANQEKKRGFCGLEKKRGSYRKNSFSFELGGVGNQNALQGDLPDLREGKPPSPRKRILPGFCKVRKQSAVKQKNC